MCTNCKQQNPAKHQKRWSEEDIGVMVLLYAKGTPIPLIAENLERTEISILHRLSMLGLVEFNRSRNAYYTVPTLLYQFK